MDRVHLTKWPERRQKITVQEAAELNGISEDTFRRRYRHLIKKLGLRCDRVELGDALDLGSENAA